MQVTRREGGKGRKTRGKEGRQGNERVTDRDIQRVRRQEKRGEGVKACVPGLSGM